MTTHSTTAEDRLARLGIHLPDAPTPFGAYVPGVQTGTLLFLSGMLATSGHTATVVGVLGRALDVKAGREAAYTAALNVLALTKKQLGGPSPRASSLVSRAFRSVRRSSWRSSWKCSPEAPVSPGHRLPIRQAATRQISAPSRRNTRMAWS
jgi:hypothetical protein